MTETVQRLVAELDAAVQKDGAQVQLSQYGGGPDESRVIATQRGYLRLGIEFLRAAYAPPSGKAPTQIAVDLDYLLTDDSDIGFDWFERVEMLPAPSKATASRSSFIPIAFGVAMLLCLVGLLLVGFVTVFRWLFHL